MRILWDFRLFSYGYRDRGVGVFVRGMAKAIMDEGLKSEIYIWGNREHVPAELAGYAVRWIPYEKGTWKTDLFLIPYLIVRHRIDLFHYWVAMGPIFRIGMGLFHPCATCMTVHDCGVEHVRGDAFLSHVRNTGYWKVQKILLAKADAVVCNSNKTRDEVLALTHGKVRHCDVIYMPVARPSAAAVPNRRQRSRMFFTLGGAEHKNVRGTVEGFLLFLQTHPNFRLAILGAVEKGEIPGPGCGSVLFEGIERAAYYLDNAAGLVVCSTYEGLGIPPLMALSRGCPLVASDISVFHETCHDAARFVDPHDASSIALGMNDVADNQEAWVKKSKQGFERYMKMSENAGKQWAELYHG